jgi:hypothetical protein
MNLQQSLWEGKKNRHFPRSQTGRSAAFRASVKSWKGRTGHWPVPPGDPPDGMERGVPVDPLAKVSPVLRLFRSASRRSERAGRPFYPVHNGRYESWAWVARATGPCRPATRRTEWRGAVPLILSPKCRLSSGSSGRRVADRNGRVARSTHFTMTAMDRGYCNTRTR